MILFFRTPSKSVMAVECDHALTQAESDKLCWLFGKATPESEENLKGHFVGPRREMITPWSTNAVEITQNMGLSGISRIEEYFPVKDENADRDPMLQRMYKGLDQEVFTTNRKPDRSSISNTWKLTTKKKVWHSLKKRWTTSRK